MSSSSTDLIRLRNGGAGFRNHRAEGTADHDGLAIRVRVRKLAAAYAYHRRPRPGSRRRRSRSPGGRRSPAPRGRGCSAASEAAADDPPVLDLDVAVDDLSVDEGRLDAQSHWCPHCHARQSLWPAQRFGQYHSTILVVRRPGLYHRSTDDGRHQPRARSQVVRGVVAVDDVSLEIADGEFLVLVGPVRLREVDAAAHDRGPRGHDGGPISIGYRDVTDLPPKDRDIAMVFQTYALYPHMSVRQNIGYGLKARRTPKPEIAKRVDEVAAMLGLSDLLDRRPAQLSGGQRQRVAMGRAIAREPQAFLLDEPLSNLDAKLRVGMRASLAQLHQPLGITTVYVTHDQVEAMTLGQRVAVMRNGQILQVDTPHRLYTEPCDLFVAGFIGSPAMNLVEATIEGGVVRFADFSVPLAPGRGAADGPVILGIRPEGFEDPAFAPGLPTIEVLVEVLEDLGSDAHVFFTVDARSITAEVLGGGRRGAGADRRRRRALHRPGRRAHGRASVGARVELAVDPERLHFFDPHTGARLFPPLRPSWPPAEKMGDR